MRTILSHMFAAGLVFLMAAPCIGAGPMTIVNVGDSYINSFGIVKHDDRFAGLLSARLHEEGYQVSIDEPGMKNSSLDALNWLQGLAGQPLLAHPDGHALILESGDNDCLLFELNKTRENLEKILSLLAAKSIPVLVVGTVPHDECMVERGVAYATDYPAMYADLAAKYDELLYVDFKAGIEGREDLVFHDHIHPNKAGEQIVVTNILPSVIALLDRVKSKEN